jgi:hypothetical protein
MVVTVCAGSQSSLTTPSSPIAKSFGCNASDLRKPNGSVNPRPFELHQVEHKDQRIFTVGVHDAVGNI